MKAFARLRVVLILTAAGLAVFPYALTAIAQDVGGDIGRRRNISSEEPETKKRTPKPSTVVKPGKQIHHESNYKIRPISGGSS